MARTNRRRDGKDIDNRLSRKKKLGEKRPKTEKNFKLKEIDYNNMTEEDYEELEKQYE